MKSWLFLFPLLAVATAYGQSLQDSVRFLPLNASIPAGAEKIGSIKLGNNATAVHCDYDKRVEEAKAKARKMGGNVVKVTELVAPSFVSKCYKIKADVYTCPSLPPLPVPAKIPPLHSPDQPYALLCIYRLADTTAFAAPYKLHLDKDSVSYYIKSKSRDSVKVYKEGEITLWAETESRKELKMVAKTGHTYYIRCGLEMGEMRGVPVIALVETQLGQKEFGQGQTRKELEVGYLAQPH